MHLIHPRIILFEPFVKNRCQVLLYGTRSSPNDIQCPRLLFYSVNWGTRIPILGPCPKVWYTHQVWGSLAYSFVCMRRGKATTCDNIAQLGFEVFLCSRGYHVLTWPVEEVCWVMTFMFPVDGYIANPTFHRIWICWSCHSNVSIFR